MLQSFLFVSYSKLIKIFIEHIFFWDSWLKIICYCWSKWISFFWNLVSSFKFNVRIANYHLIAGRNNLFHSKIFIWLLWIYIFLKILHVKSLEYYINFHTLIILVDINFHSFNSKFNQVRMRNVLNTFINDFCIPFILKLLFC